MPCILLEYAELGDLMQKLQPSPGQVMPMRARDTNSVMHALVNALIYVHIAGYIHRDVKPPNVLICKQPGSGRVIYKLSDFDLAIRADDEVENIQLDGTQGFIPPERFWCRSSDSWALGRLLLTCRAGTVPPPGHVSLEQLQASGVYDYLPDPMREIEWDFFLRVCLIEHGSDRPCVQNLHKHTAYLTTPIY
jgi:serine/threonine protein kinase